MLVYLLGFAISVLVLWCIRNQHTDSAKFVCCSVIALLIPCLIAGLRDVSIGTDVEGYVVPLFDLANESSSFAEFYNSSWFSIWRYRYVAGFEIGFVILVYVLTKLFGSVAVILFVVQLITVVPIYLSLVQFGKLLCPGKKSLVWLGMAIYYLMFFNYSLNMMRQFMAMGVLFLGFYCLVAKKFIKAACSIAVAAFFHTSGALMGALIFAVYMFFATRKRSNDERLVAAVSAIAPICLLCLPLIANLMRLVGLSYYANYLGDGQVVFNFKYLLFKLPPLIALLCNWKRFKEETPAAGFYVVMAVFDIAAAQLVSVFSQSSRIALYFSEYSMVSLPTVALSSESSEQSVFKYKWYAAILGYALAYWLVAFCFYGWGETFPYVFA